LNWFDRLGKDGMVLLLMAGWKLIYKIVGSLGQGWQVGASALQDSGEYRGLASGPNGMRLFFIARTEKLDPSMEHICPPLGWLRVDGRLHLNDEDLSARLSIMLRESLSPEEMANEIMVRLFPVYRDFLGAIEKHNLQSQPSQTRQSDSVQVHTQETVTEQQAASYFVRRMLEESARAWPSTYEALKASLGDKFVVEDEKMASFNWYLAAISLGLQGVKNTFPEEQARRIENWIFIDMNDQWAIDEVKRYEAAFLKGRGEAPLGGVVGRLLHRWLGKNSRDCEAEILGQKTGFIDVWAMLETERVLTELAVTWNWKKIRDDFNLVPSPEIRDEDIPF
jgi:hypothetical protein